MWFKACLSKRLTNWECRSLDMPCILDECWMTRSKRSASERTWQLAWPLSQIGAARTVSVCGVMRAFCLVQVVILTAADEDVHRDAASLTSTRPELRAGPGIYLNMSACRSFLSHPRPPSLSPLTHCFLGGVMNG
jgi:hypothetical protein